MLNAPFALRLAAGSLLPLLGLVNLAQAQESLIETAQVETEPIETVRPFVPPLKVVVNSAQDGPRQEDEDLVLAEDDRVIADGSLTLREAIHLVNGDLQMADLSPAEQDQVERLFPEEQSQIQFDLPAGQTTIELAKLLPAIATPGTVVDGTTQPGYDASRSATAEIEVPIPIVALTVAPEAEVFRGLTLVADDITVRGLSLYGFAADHRSTQVTPPADIFISHMTPPPYKDNHPVTPARFFTFRLDEDRPPTGIVIEDNWLGLTPEGRMPMQPSTFGVSVFHSQGALIQRNRIANHDGSGIITSVRAENLEVSENIITGNGLAGMPDGIRLEGVLTGSSIHSNLICANDGSGIFMFKPETAGVTIRNNDIKHNGRRLRRAAVYVMGNDSLITDNLIRHQEGPGVVVTAYPQSHRNLIENNRFEDLQGLSIDLNTRHNTLSQDFQVGDGPNPPRRNSNNRQSDTGNAAINAPLFISQQAYELGDQVLLEGTVEPNAVVTFYLTSGGMGDYGPLNEPLGTVQADEEGRFTFGTRELSPGIVVSAIATHPDFGTSEPALNLTVISPDGAGATISQADGLTKESSELLVKDLQQATPQCTTAPQPPVPVAIEPVPEPTSLPAPPEAIELRIPRNIHFGLDLDNISPASAAILDQIAAALQQHPSLTVELQGHTDLRASVAYNKALAKRRANNARRYLMQKGIAPERMTILSLGESNLRTDGQSKVDHARNRRVEFIFKDTRGLDVEFIDQESDLQLER